MTTIRLLGSALILVMMTACTTYEQSLTDWAGNTHVCQHQGSIGTGAKIARAATDNCIKTMGAIGYIDQQAIGDTGIRMNREDAHAIAAQVPRIEDVIAGSPANKAGVLAGDLLLSINKTPVSDARHARKLLFGQRGTPVQLRVLRESQALDFHLIRLAPTDGNEIQRVQMTPVTPRTLITKTNQQQN